MAATLPPFQYYTMLMALLTSLRPSLGAKLLPGGPHVRRVMRAEHCPALPVCRAAIAILFFSIPKANIPKFQNTCADLAIMMATDRTRHG
jgi:hypothetical protein